MGQSLAREPFWEKSYQRPGRLDTFGGGKPSPEVVSVAAELPVGSRALDLGCGEGRNALYLAGLGWQVTAVDGSASAIRIVRERARTAGLHVETQVADLEAGTFPIAPNSYDLIADFLYLQRDLFPAIREGVKPGGVFSGEVLVGAESPFRMQPGQLRSEFDGWKILYYSEAGGADSNHRTARIIARRA